MKNRELDNIIDQKQYPPDRKKSVPEPCQIFVRYFYIVRFNNGYSISFIVSRKESMSLPISVKVAGSVISPFLFTLLLAP